MSDGTSQTSPAGGPLALFDLLVVRPLSSMILSVVLVVLLGLLTWLGTLAQIESSTYAVQQEYFESWFVVAKLPVSIWGTHLFDMKVPLPGAYPVMGLLFVNLMVGGLVRMKWNVRNCGILITHLGIALLLVAGFVKMHYSYAGNLSLYEAPPADAAGAPGRVYQSSRFVSFHDFELALLVDRGDQIEERVVPEQALWPARLPASKLPEGAISGPGRTVTLTPDGLPFTLEVTDFVDHARALPKGPMVSSPCEVVDGNVLQPQRWPPGQQPRSEAEIAGCYVKVVPKNGAPIRGIVWGFPRLPFDEARYPFAFTVDGVRYGLDLRHVVRELPFALKLDRFQKLDHPGTMSPKDFRSYVSVIDERGEQKAEIFMNYPLRRDGFVVYQTSWGPQPMGGPPWYSVFEVSYNPSDMWPMLACFVIAAGLLIHFVMKLRRFLDSSTYSTLQRE
ncbi:MAG: cytochrome c biogenesis protein ResB [Planctomycetota bacterium]|jgi:hypothetical protein